MGITACWLAKDIGVPPMRISEDIAGKRGITVHAGLCLLRCAGLHDGFCTGLQLDHEAARAEGAVDEVLARIKPLPWS
ncbi:MAG: addiction module antidote protein, HigA family [Rubrivivax sp.]